MRIEEYGNDNSIQQPLQKKIEYMKAQCMKWNTAANPKRENPILINIAGLLAFHVALRIKSKSAHGIEKSLPNVFVKNVHTVAKIWYLLHSRKIWN